MVPSAYAPPPRPVVQVQVVQSISGRTSFPIVIPGAGGKRREPSNRQERRAYRAHVVRDLRRRHFSKFTRRAAPALVSVINVRAEVKGLI